MSHLFWYLTSHFEVDLLPGVTSMNLALKCPDPSSANALPPRLLEDHSGQNYQKMCFICNTFIVNQVVLSGWLSAIYPFAKPIPYSGDLRFKVNSTLCGWNWHCVVKTAASIWDLQACDISIYLFWIYLSAKRCFWYNGDDVWRHHELAPYEERDGDGGG